MPGVFTLFWKDGRREEVFGTSFADAMNLAGYSSGVLAALDFYVSGRDTTYSWNGRNWVIVCKYDVCGD